jgi:hypothetical protein
MLEMANSDLIDKLSIIIDEATKAEDFKLAKELGYIQLGIIDERTREWERGYDCGYDLAMKEIEMRRMKDDQA